MRTQSRTFSTALVVVVLAAAGAFLLSGSANASEVTDGSGGAVVVPNYPEVVFVAPASSVNAKTSDGATFYPTGTIGENTLVVMPEIYQAAGLTYKDVAQIHTRAGFEKAMSTNTSGSRASCGGVVTGVYGVWSTPLASPCPQMGNDWGFHVYYSWSVAAGTNQDASVMGLGFYRGYYGSQFGVWKQYYGLGVGGDGEASVPWGLTAAYPTVKAQSTIIAHIAQVTFEP